MPRITFKAFLEAKAYGSAHPNWASVKAEEAEELIRSKCSDALWMLEKKAAIYRGEHTRYLDIVNETGYATVDPSKTRRASQNTSNHYTVIIDNLPAYKDFPKRQASFICALSPITAARFGTAERGKREHVVVLIPYNGVKIGVVPTSDIWDVPLRSEALFGSGRTSPPEFNDVLFELGANGGWEGIVDYCEELKDSKPEDDVQKKFYQIFRRAKPGAHAHFLEHIEKMFSPESLSLEVTTSKNLIDYGQGHNELWVGGPCVALSWPVWLKITNDSKDEDSK